MRKWLLLCVAAWIGVVSVAVWSTADQPAPQQVAASAPAGAKPSASAPAGQPKLVIEQTTHNFGEVWAPKPIEHAFKLTNGGTAPLEIIRVQPTCGCTAAGTHPMRLAPGESGMFPFRLDTAKLHGKFTKSVNIEVNDPAIPKVTLTLSGECKRKVEVSPSDAVFGRITTQAQQERVLTITNRSEKALIANLVEPPASHKFKYMLLESLPGKEYKLFINAEPPFQSGNINESITITTNIDDVPTLKVNARAIVPPRVDVVPVALHIPTPPPGPAASQPVIRQVMVNNNGDKPIKLVEAVVDDSAVQVTTAESKPGKQWRVELRMPAGYKVPDGGRTLVIKTDDAEFKELNVKVNGPKSAAAKTASTRPAVRPAMTMLNQPAPNFNLKTIDGQPVGATEFKSYPATVLNFVAPNCGYCKKQLPLVDPVRASYEPRGVRFVNMMETMGKAFTQDQIIGVLNSVGSKSQIALDTGNAVGKQFKVTGFPCLFIVDKNGRIVEVVPGKKDNIAVTLTKRLDELLKSEAGGSVATSQPAAKPLTQARGRSGS